MSQTAVIGHAAESFVIEGGRPLSGRVRASGNKNGVLPILAATHVGDWPAVLLIGLAASAHQAWSANLYTTVSDMFAKKDIATIVGLGGMAGSIGGIIFPWFSGRILDRYHALGNVTAGYAILFAICASAYLAAFAIHHLLAPRLERFPETR